MEAVRFLADHGANVNVKDMKHYTVLHHTLYGKNKSLVRFLVKRGADLKAKSLDGQTPLSGAAELRLNDIISLLLDSGANIETRSNRQWTPLHYAASGGHGAAVGILLDNTNDAGQRPEFVANSQGHTEIANFLKERTVVSKRGLKQLESRSIALFASAAGGGKVTEVSRLIRRQRNRSKWSKCYINRSRGRT